MEHRKILAGIWQGMEKWLLAYKSSIREMGQDRTNVTIEDQSPDVDVEHTYKQRTTTLCSLFSFILFHRTQVTKKQ